MDGSTCWSTCAGSASRSSSFTVSYINLRLPSPKLTTGEVYFPETFGKTLEELTFLFEDETENKEALAATAQKVLQDPTITEVHESVEKKA